jgi:hypothetical protein
MSIRVDPRRLSLLKELAAAEGVRPGQLVQRWVEARLDSERAGQPAGGSASADARVVALESSLASLTARIDEVAQRLQRVEAPSAPASPAAMASEQQQAPRRQRGRPPKADGARARSTATRTRVSRNGHVGLHDEIIAVIRERGPSTAAELATAIRDRGRYAPPRSAKALDAATVNSRVSNPVYRARFRRAEGRISLAD